MDSGSNALNYFILYAKLFIHMSKQTNQVINFYRFLPKMKDWLKLDKSMWNNNEYLSGVKAIYIIM